MSTKEIKTKKTKSTKIKIPKEVKEKVEKAIGAPKKNNSTNTLSTATK